MKKFTIVLMFFLATVITANAQWQQTSCTYSGTVKSIVVDGSYVYAGSEGGGIFISTDNGVNWNASNNGLTNLNVRAMAISGPNVFAATLGGGVFISSDHGASWTNCGLSGNQIISLYVRGANVYAGKWSNDGVYVTSDNGATWTQTSLQQEVSAFAEIGNVIFAGTKNNYVFRSTDNFATWTMVDHNLDDPFIKELVVSGTDIYAGTDGGGVYVSADSGATWAAVNSGMTILYTQSLEVVGNTIYAGTAGIYRTQNGGLKWKESDHCMPKLTAVYALTHSGNTMYAGTEIGIWKCSIDEILDKIEICMVGVNSANKNVVIWEEPVSNALDSFYVFKETNVSGIYNKIGSVSKNDSSVFVDTSSHPSIQSNKYKISYSDNCGLPLDSSAFHKTMHLAINQGMGSSWNLIWDPYEGYTVSTYNVFRGTTPNNLQLLGTSSGSNTQYTDLTPPVGFVYYQVEVVSPNACNPSKSYNYSRSNIATNKPDGINDVLNAEDYFTIFPNPCNSNFNVNTLRSSKEVVTLNIYNVLGSLVKSELLFENRQQINISNLSKGVYTVEIITKEFSGKQKLIIQR